MSRRQPCGCPNLVWVRMKSGAKMPCDDDKVSVIVSNKDGTAGELVVGRTPHWATCPKAKDYRKT